MIVGTGIDLVDMTRIAMAYERFGKHFAQKLLTEAELALMPPRAVTWIAGRFAAKEAAVKALGTGFSGGIHPRCIEVLPDASGAPCLNLLAQAQERASELHVRRSHISISHERSHAVAMVILED